MGRLEDSREVLSSRLFLMLCPPSESSTCQGTRRLQRKRIFLHALVLDRGGSPGKLRRGVRVVVRHVVFFLSWLEAIVRPESV